MAKRWEILLLFIAGITFLGKAQTIQLEGNVFSFNAKKILLLKKAQKDLSFEGPLAGALVNVTGRDFAKSYTTGINGFYSIRLDYPGIYQCTISRNGYSSVSFDLDYKSAGKKSIFESFFFILKQDENSNVRLGKVEMKSGSLAFQEGNSQNSSMLDVFNSNAHLLEKAVNINNHDNGENSNAQPKNDKVELNADSITQNNRAFMDAKKLAVVRKMSSDNLDSLKESLASAKDLLKKLSPLSEDYKSLSLQIISAEQKIKDKESIIDLKETSLSNSKRIILFLSLFLLFMLISLGLTYYFFREKKKHAIELSASNEKITKINSRFLSSVRYASVIQESFLPPISGLAKIFKDSFLYSKPKDILSGDFHWFSEVENHKIILVADCTGHGVPGAMLTVLGNRILDEIINEKGEVLPSKILLEMNLSILETFSSTKEQLDYGIDISIISLNTKTGDMLFSGIGNGFYQVSDGNLQFYKATPKSIGSDLFESDLIDQKILYKKGDSFYLFTDGFADQFAGNDQERTKFNVQRFGELILKVEKLPNLSNAPAVFENELLNWMGVQNLQVDDICIMGFRL